MARRGGEGGRGERVGRAGQVGGGEMGSAKVATKLAEVEQREKVGGGQAKKCARTPIAKWE